MSNIKISQLELTSAVADSVVPVSDASGTVTNKVTLGSIANLLEVVSEYADLTAFPTTGEESKIYVDKATNKIYRWTGSSYVELSAAEVTSVAGQTGVVTLDKNDVGLGDVDNTSDANKPVSTATQTALDDKSDIGHTHDDRYYTETEIDNKFAAAIGSNSQRFTLEGYTSETPFPVLLSQSSGVIGVPVPAGKAMVGTLTVVAVTNSALDSKMSRFVRQFSIKNVDGATTFPAADSIVTIGTDQKEDASHEIDIKANDADDRLDIEVSSDGCARWVAVVEATTADHTFANENCEPNCCEWDGNTFIEFGADCNNVLAPVQFTRTSLYEWSADGTLECGDTFSATISCNPSVVYSGPESCDAKWALTLSINCVNGLTITGIRTSCECGAPPVWNWSGDTSNCNCCGPTSTEYSVAFGGVLKPSNSFPCYLKAQSTYTEGTVSGCDGGSLAINGVDYEVNTDWSPSSNGAVGTIVTAELQSAGLGNAASDFTDFVSGRIALVQRGVESFQTKVNNAVAAGAAGVIIYNNTTGVFGPSVTASIPVVMITQALGESLVGQSGVNVSFDGGGPQKQVEIVGGAGSGGGAPQIPKSGFKYSISNNVNTTLICPREGFPNGDRYEYSFTPVPGIDFSHVLTNAVSTLGDAYVDVVDMFSSGSVNGCLERFTLLCYDSSDNLIDSIVLKDGITTAFTGSFNGIPLIVNLPVGTKRVDLEILENANRLDIPSNNCDPDKVFVGDSPWYYKLFIIE